MGSRRAARQRRDHALHAHEARAFHQHRDVAAQQTRQRLRERFDGVEVNGAVAKGHGRFMRQRTRRVQARNPGRARIRADLAMELRSGIAEVWGPIRLGNEIQRVRSVFKYAWESGLMFEEVTGTLFCGDLFTHLGDGEPLTRETIVPAAIAGTERLSRLGPLRVRYGTPLAVEGLDPREATDRLMAEIERLGAPL